MAIESLYESAKWYDEPKLDKYSTSEVAARESFLVPASSEGDEVTPRRTNHRLHGLTSFFTDDGNEPATIADEFSLSAHTNIADLTELHCVTSNHLVNNAKSLSQHTPRQATTLDMAPPTVQRSRRVKYKEEYKEAVDLAIHHEQAQPDCQLASESRPHVHPHMVIPIVPSASLPTITSGRKGITQLLSTEQTATLAKTVEIQKAPKSDFSSSQSSDPHYTSPDIDSAVDMRDKNRRRHKQVSTNEDQELVFQGRLPGKSSDATISSMKYDSTNGNGNAAGKAGGRTDRPALAVKSTNQTTSNKSGKAEPMAKVQSSTTGQTLRKPKPVKKQSIQASESKSPGNSWDIEHPPLPNDARNGGSPRKRNNYSGRVHVDHNPRKLRESPWIKDSLIPKGDPKRHQARWASSSLESSLHDSNRASSGWGTRRKREDDGTALGDWSGGMAPASIDWDNRAPFRDHQTEVKIDNWVATVSSALALVDQVTFTEGAKAFSFTGTVPHRRYVFAQEQGDVIPRYWVPTHAEGNTVAVFWDNHISSESQPRPLDDCDHDRVKPWWQRYTDATSCMLQEYQHPWIAGNDPDETADERSAREFDSGGMTAGVNRKAAEKAKRDAERKRRLARVAKAYKFSGNRTSSAAPAMPNAIKSGLNIFLRSATKADVIPLRDMYNRYIDNAFVVPETSRRTDSDMLKRLQAARDAKLPFIVACQRGEVIKARKKQQHGGEDVVTPDKVVGFACAVDWINKEETIYRITVQMEVFVDMDHYMKKIGSCLADKLIGLLDPSIIERGGYETVGEELDGVGPSKVVSNVMIRYSYEAQNTEKLAWVSEWLNKRFEFQKVADLQGVAQKFDKKLNLAIFQKAVTI